MTYCTKKKYRTDWGKYRADSGKHRADSGKYRADCHPPLRRVAAILLVCFAVICSGPAHAVVIEPDPDLQRVMGDLYSLSAAMRLYYDDTHKTRCPSLDELAHYLKKPLPNDWPAEYRTAAIQGGWWAGRKVPELSTARKFLREKAPSLFLYEQDSQSAWLGGAFIWMNALSFDEKTKPAPEQFAFKAAQGEGDDRQYLFFNSPGTDYYWKSGLIYTSEAHSEALKKFGTDAKGPFVTSPAPYVAPETLTASPVNLPPDFTLSGEEELDIRLGDVLINPIPRPED